MNEMVNHQLSSINLKEPIQENVTPDWRAMDATITDFVEGHIENAQVTYKREVLEGDRVLPNKTAKRLIVGKKDKELLNIYIQQLGTPNMMLGICDLTP